MRDLNRKIAAVTACVTIAAVLGVVSCQEPKPPDTVKGGVTDRPECPHLWSERITGADSFKILPSGNLSVPGWTTNVPEFHDCQRFRVRNARKPGFSYDSLQAIFVRENLDSAYRAGADAMLVRGEGPATLRGRTTPGAPGQAARSFGIVVGVIMSEGDYKPLGLYRGFNCLFLQRTGAVYHATLISVGFDDVACFTLDMAPTHPPEPLLVYERTAAQLGVSMADIPAVARWDWDSAAAEHYIGLKCPTGWCELTKRSPHTPSVSYAAVASGPPSARRVRLVKGWYDEQSVANIDAAGQLVADGPKATAFAHPDLASYALSTFAPGRWLPTADIAMPNVSPTYTTKYKYVSTSNPEVADGHFMNVEMCTDSVPGGIAPGDPCGTRVLMPLCENAWFARVSYNGAVLNHFCVKYRGFPTGFSIPGVVRWRWRAKDETLWIRCPTGCCELDSFK